jgi:hypothetical protein
MPPYIKVTLKEFESMRSEVESGLSQCGQFEDEDAIKTAHKAAKAARAVEKRNKLTPSPYLGDDD